MEPLYEIEFRPFAPSDVTGVNELLREAYGPSYPYEAKPEVPAGAYYFVAVERTHHVVVGFARSRWLEAEAVPHAYPQVHELGGYVVREAFRRRGIGEHLSLLCEQAARVHRGEVHVSHSEPVSWGNGLASQRIFQRHGFRVLGLSALKYPDISTAWHGTQPASMTIVARRAGSEPNFVQTKRYLPRVYEELVQGLLRDCVVTDHANHLLHLMPPLVMHTPVEASGLVGAEIVDIPANWPDALRLVGTLQEEGYLFSAFLPEHGVLPHGQDTIRFDYLRLYRPPLACRRGCDWGLIQVLPAAEQVKRFLVEEYSRRYR